MSEGTTIRGFIDAAASDGALARRLLADRPALLNERYLNGETALHFLAVEGCVEGVRLGRGGSGRERHKPEGHLAMGDDSPTSSASTADEVARLAIRVRDGSIHEACTAIGRLASLGAPAVSVLVEATDDDEQWWDEAETNDPYRDPMLPLTHLSVRAAAFAALKKIGAPALPGLFSLLGHSKVAVRWTALEVLLELAVGDSIAQMTGRRPPIAMDIVPELSRRMTDPALWFPAAISTFSTLAEDTPGVLVPVLAAARHDENELVRRAAEDALRRLGPPTQEAAERLGGSDPK